jgi:two-component system sensor histidine kinase PilS (NtrC family)
VDSRPPRPRMPFRVSTTQLPEPHVLLRGMYVGRLFIAAAFVLRSLTVAAERGLMLPAAALFAAAAAVSLGSFAYTGRWEQRPGQTFLYGQVIADTVLLTAIVYLTGGPQSVFAPLYILVIFAAALLLPILGGVLIALLAMVLYFASVWITDGALADTAVLQILLFGIVALLTGYLADRLRQTGAALGEVQTELRQLRLDTGDILDSINTAVLTVDQEGCLAYINAAAEDILSLSGDEWIGQPILKVLDDVAPGLGGVIERSARERIAVRRFETDRIKDEAFVLGVSTTLVERPGADRPAVTAIFQDITEKMRVEALRRRAERLEAVAELSASLAHEIKNPLASIRSAVEQISAGSVGEEDGKVLSALVVRESDRLSRLLTEFIDFARVKVTAPEPVDFTAVVGNVVDLVRAHPEAADRTIDLSTDRADDGLRIRGAEDLLHRAVLNLVLNAVQWAGPGGRVDLKLDEVRSDLLSPALGTLSLLRLMVSDTGPGVPEDVVEHIFDPFFTRRAGGTGLGLALVQRAVEAHSGAVFVDNAPPGSGRGATFTLYLPAVAPVQPAPAAATHTHELNAQ